MWINCAAATFQQADPGQPSALVSASVTPSLLSPPPGPPSSLALVSPSEQLRSFSRLKRCRDVWDRPLSQNL